MVTAIGYPPPCETARTDPIGLTISYVDDTAILLTAEATEIAEVVVKKAALAVRVARRVGCTPNFQPNNSAIHSS